MRQPTTSTASTCTSEILLLRRPTQREGRTQLRERRQAVGSPLSTPTAWRDTKLPEVLFRNPDATPLTTPARTPLVDLLPRHLNTSAHKRSSEVVPWS